MTQGVPFWDGDIDYEENALVGTGMGLFVASVPTGPATGNSTDPTDADQTVWRVY